MHVRPDQVSLALTLCFPSFRDVWFLLIFVTIALYSGCGSRRREQGEVRMWMGAIVPRGELVPFQLLLGPRRRPRGVSLRWALGKWPLRVHRQ